MFLVLNACVWHPAKKACYILPPVNGSGVYWRGQSQTSEHFAGDSDPTMYEDGRLERDRNSSLAGAVASIRRPNNRKYR